VAAEELSGFAHFRRIPAGGLRRIGLGMVIAVAGGSLAAASHAQVYSIATNPQGSQIYSAGAAVAKVAVDKLKLQIRVQPMAGSTTYVPLVGSGEVDFGLANVEEVLTAVAGRGNFAGRPNPGLRVLAVLFPLPISVLVPADSPVKAMADLKGVRLPSGYAGQSIAQLLQDTLLASAGLTMADVRPVPVVNVIQATEALANGRVDAAIIGPGTAQVQQANVELAGRGGVRFLQVDSSPAALAIMRKFVPMRIVVFQPAPQFPGIVERTDVLAVSMYLVANQKLPDDAIYQLVKALHESADELARITPVLRRFDPNAMTEAVDVPWHPGAVKFYREVGAWPPKS
jgi:TRAP transporter TAXI family solute receptor